ncbi:DUF1853 family protein [Litoribrevibacter euphylliae]|uniref:DUF1853 family protein n=1 Tax=Litoribrevibacter euphylliae TaxID=1834034 RepID=A0ABV7H7R4_9GAMM
MPQSLNAFNFSHQYVADLAWIIYSAPLLKEQSLSSELTPSELSAPSFTPQTSTTTPTADWLEQLAKLNHSPSPLIHHIESRQSTRVGFYYEALISYLLSTFPGVIRLAEHLQLQKNGRTLGEIDFLYRDEKTNKVIHLETAVKFYLGSKPWLDASHPFKHWLGPMIKDRLDLKTQHLINHQSQMCLSESFTELSKQLNLPQPTHREVLMQGYLFTHPSEPVSLPYNVENENTTQRPLWFARHEIDAFLSNDDKFIILKKPFWLSPFHSKEHNQLLDRDSLKEQLDSLIEQWNRPILISILSTNELSKTNHALFQENNRCFIVPDNWAGISAPNT